MVFHGDLLQSVHYSFLNLEPPYIWIFIQRVNVQLRKGLWVLDVLEKMVPFFRVRLPPIV